MITCKKNVSYAALFTTLFATLFTALCYGVLRCQERAN